MILSSGLNVWYVRNVNNGSRGVRVIPGYDSPIRAVPLTISCTSVPMTEWYAFSQLNNQFKTLSSPGAGLYRIAQWTSPVVTTYQTYRS